MVGHMFRTREKTQALVCAGVLLVLICSAGGSVFVCQEADKDGCREDSGLEAGLKRQAEREGVLQEREEEFGAERRENAERAEKIQEENARLNSVLVEYKEKLSKAEERIAELEAEAKQRVEHPENSTKEYTGLLSTVEAQRKQLQAAGKDSGRSSSEPEHQDVYWESPYFERLSIRTSSILS
ncbi:uncharacterized protein NEMAJ01_1167 [Nematocida major]|uniref:uncharacterized protein n=1 Tax=Nematocida major TaxID=1912982 RepID=UPI002007F582|nr:uncharacterized protein NEMAJ01_1167 [Nematocida major]KAH9386271.1 hypothetical protein NEMAJ01_1167 [Nematocida major]